MTRDQKIMLRMKAHKVAMDHRISGGIDPDEASKAAYDEVFGKTPLKLQRIIDKYANA